MQKSTRILCSIFGFFLTLALLVPQVTIAAKSYFLDQNEIFNRLCTESNVLETIELILDDCNHVADSCGISHSVFDGIFAPDQVLLDMQAAVRHGLYGGDFQLDSTLPMAQLAENVQQNLRELENITDTSFYDGDIETFCKQISEIYCDYLDLKIYSYFGDIEYYADKALQMALIVCAAVAALTLAMLWITTRKLGLYLRELAFSFIGSGGLVTGIMIYLAARKPFAQLLIAPMFLRETIAAYAQDGVFYLLFIGIATLIIGILLFVLAALLIRRDAAKMIDLSTAESSENQTND